MDAAVTAFMSEPGGEPFQFADGTTLDLEAAVQANPLALIVLSDETLSDTSKRTAVYLAFLQAVAEQS